MNFFQTLFVFVCFGIIGFSIFFAISTGNYVIPVFFILGLLTYYTTH